MRLWQLVKRLITIGVVTFLLHWSLNNILAQESSGLEKPPYSGVRRIEAKVVRHLVKTSKVFLIDIPSNRPYEQYHICGAVNATKIKSPDLINIEKIPRDYTIIVYCD
jgi:hypothetical protein